MSTTLLTSVGYGLSVGLNVPTAEVEQARQWLPWWWRDQDVQPETVWHADSAADCEQVARELELWVAEYAVDRVFVHAGVVYVDGGALLFPGRSFSGKSTLVAALVERGAKYGSDEYAVISPDGLVHPYPRPISMRAEDGTRPRIQVPEDQVGEPAPVSLVAHLHHDPDVEPELAPISVSQSVLRLLDNTVAAQTRSDEALTFLTTAVAGASVLAGARGHAPETADRLLDGR